MKKITFLFLALCFLLSLQAENYPYRSDVLWLTTPNHADWLYKCKEEAEISVALYHYGILQNDIEITYQIGPEMLPADVRGKVKLKEGKAIISLGTMDQPGFRDCQLSVSFQGKEFKHHIKVGFEPEKLEPYTADPDDFDAFWQGAIAEAEKCPMVVEKTLVPEYCNDKINCYLVKIQALEKKHYVYGYLSMPKKPGRYPVVLSPPGAGIKPIKLKHLFYAENDVIRFDMEIHGIRPDLDAATYKEISRAFGSDDNSYFVNGLADKDSYYMKKAYLRCIRALDYLTTLPEWDGKNLIAQGGSQGGALAIVTAALDSRVTACAANHPALSDMAAYKAGRAGGYPHLFTRFNGVDTPEKLETLAYYDVVNFARRLKVPVFMTWGYNDNVCPPTTSYTVYNVIPGKKEALLTPVNEHWVSENTRRVILNWIQAHLQ